MRLLQMSFSGGVLILAVLFVRALAIRHLPKDMFLILWGIVLLRLIVPFSVPTELSVYSWGNGAVIKNDMYDPDEEDTIRKMINDTSVGNGAGQIWDVEDDASAAVGANQMQDTKNDTSVGFGTDKNTVSMWLIIWCVGMSACAVCFLVSYLRCRVEFQTSLPVDNPFARQWLAKHCRRHSSIRQSDRISTPLTYGVLRPVILMPKSTDWENTQQLQYVLTHEYVHICRLDTLTKLVCVGALCVHWFNPLVWIMYVFFNRDVEISCDEHVVRCFGETSKSAYARMLIQMEAQRSQVKSFLPLGSSLLPRIGKNAMEERIQAIMKVKKNSLPAVMLAAVLVISVTVIFATSAAEKTEAGNNETAAALPGTGFTEEECAKLLALQFDGYEDMSVSAFQHRVWTYTDTEEYRELLERFSLDETLLAQYENDSSGLLRFLYNILEPLTAEKWETRSFGGYTATDVPGALDNALLEYEVTLTILDADLLTVRAYDTARQHVMDGLKTIFQSDLGGLSVSELRDEELMQILLDEEIDNITAAWEDDKLRIAVDYYYRPLGEVSADDMELDPWQQADRAEIDAQMAPFTPFGLTYEYDTDELKMFFAGKEVRGIYDTVQGIFISAHIGIGEGIYDGDEVDLYAVYDGRELVGLREATPQEMEEATEKRQAVTDAYKEAYREVVQTLRQEVPATGEDYQRLLALKTPDYRSKSVADFNMEVLDWANENYEGMERIGVDNLLGDYHVPLTDAEISFVAVTAHLSRMENAEYVRSLNKNEPERDVLEGIYLPGKQEYNENGYGAWCSLYYTFSYHISDKETVRVGERDDCVGGMMDSIRGYWESSTVDQMVGKTEEEILDTLHAIAEKYSSRSITITIHDDQTSFECMDERQ